MILEKGTYWVSLEVKLAKSNCAEKNYCFKQRMNDKASYPEKDMQGSMSNGHPVMKFDKTGYLKDWRYATDKEAIEYERRGEPYDVTELSQEPIEQLLTTIL